MSRLQFIDNSYLSDAHNSLSIEGYAVTPELIERVRTGAWNPDSNANDRQNRDAIAARGYWAQVTGRPGSKFPKVSWPTRANPSEPLFR